MASFEDYDEFGNYIGADLDSDDEDGEEGGKKKKKKASGGAKGGFAKEFALRCVVLNSWRSYLR